MPLHIVDVVSEVEKPWWTTGKTTFKWTLHILLQMQDYMLSILCLRMCCASRLSVSLHRITNVAMLLGRKVCFLPWNENCYCASRTTNSVSLPGLWRMFPSIRITNACVAYYTHFIHPQLTTFLGIIDVDEQLKSIIINYLGMSEIRCFKFIAHNLIMLFVV